MLPISHGQVVYDLTETRRKKFEKKNVDNKRTDDGKRYDDDDDDNVGQNITRCPSQGQKLIHINGVAGPSGCSFSSLHFFFFVDVILGNRGERNSNYFREKINKIFVSRSVVRDVYLWTI